METVWKEYHGYKVSDKGDVIGLSGKSIGHEDRDGYIRVALYIEGKKWLTTIHQLVMLLHVGEKPFDNAEVNHKDKNRKNNSVENLEYVTSFENLQHMRLFPCAFDYTPKPKVEIENFKGEEWRAIEAFNGLYGSYFASNMGRIKKQCNGFEKIVKGSLTKYGYHRVTLGNGGTKNTVLVHRLVALSFIGEIPEGYVVHHINENKLDNRLVNLEICTIRQNVSYSVKSKTKSSSKVGVSFSKQANMFSVQIEIFDTKTHIGYYKCENMARKCYEKYLQMVELFEKGKAYEKTVSLDTLTDSIRKYEGGTKRILELYTQSDEYKALTERQRKLLPANLLHAMRNPKSMPMLLFKICKSIGIIDGLLFRKKGQHILLTT